MRALAVSLALGVVAGIVSRGLSASAWRRARCGPADLTTAWTGAVNASVAPLGEYPRPQMTRGPSIGAAPIAGASWASLHGLWEFEIADAPAGTPRNPIPFARALNGTILMPFPPESCLSGVGAYGDWPHSTPNFTFSWSRLVFDAPPLLWQNGSQEAQLHIEACDWNCTIWLNSLLIASHTGGYDAFSAAVSLAATGNELLIFAHDPTERGAQPQGKQLTLDVDGHHVDGNKYCPTSGVWGEVWLEAVPAARIADVQLRTNASALFLWVTLAGVAALAPPCALNVSVSLLGAHVTSALMRCDEAGAAGGVQLSVPSPRAWASGAPVLYDADIELLLPPPIAATAAAADAADADAPAAVARSAVASTSDTVRVYFGLRSVGMRVVARPPTPPLGPLFNTSISGAGRNAALPRGASWRDCEAACAAAASPPCAAWVLAEDVDPPSCVQFSGVGLPLLPFAAQRTAGKLSLPAGPAAVPTLSGRDVFRLGWLDQSFWPEGAYRAPTDEALAFDLSAALDLGFNAVRLHTKVNSRRFYYHADKLGVLVLQDAVQKFGGEGAPLRAESVPLFLGDLRAMIDGRGNAPSIVQWTLFNEGDCVSIFNASEVAAWAEEYDGLASPHGRLGAGRVIDTNSGGPANDLHVGNVNDVHTYPAPGVPMPSATQLAMVGEFSGLGVFPEPAHSWLPGQCYAYEVAATPDAFADTYCAYASNLALEAAVRVSGAIATQSVDLECECDGFYNYDRTRKFDAARAAQIATCNAALIASAARTSGA